MARPGDPWASDTRAVLMSLTKGLTAVCVQVLADRGQVDLEAPVSAYWPEFAAGGKEGVLVRHVLTHTAGVLGFPGQQNILRLDGTGWDDYGAIADPRPGPAVRDVGDGRRAGRRPGAVARVGARLRHGAGAQSRRDQRGRPKWAVADCAVGPRHIGNFAAPGLGLRYGPAQSAFGSEGGGGQIAFCDPESRISAGFVRSQLDMPGRFSAGLIDALYRCAGERA
jgi:CubicO group peptidase (beta-lactamase class C family)